MQTIQMCIRPTPFLNNHVPSFCTVSKPSLFEVQVAYNYSEFYRTVIWIALSSTTSFRMQATIFVFTSD